LDGQAIFWAKTGRMKQALPAMQEVHDLEPLSRGSSSALAWGYVGNNQPDAAIALLDGRTGMSFGMMSRLASAYAMKGQFDKAADIIIERGRGRLVPAFHEA